MRVRYYIYIIIKLYVSFSGTGVGGTTLVEADDHCSQSKVYT